MRWRRTAWILLLGLGLLGLGRVAPASADLVERVALEPGVALRVEIERGDIEVRTHPDSDVRIEARARGVGASSVHFRLEPRDDELLLRGVADPWVGWLRAGPRIVVRIWMPEAGGVTIRTGGGDVRVEGVAGPVVARTRGGAIRVSDVDGSVDARTPGGSIATRSVRGDVRAEAAGGRVDVWDVDGDVHALTRGDGGDVQLGARDF